MSIIVIGSAGQVGKEVMRLSLQYPSLQVTGFNRDELDITNTDDIKKALIMYNAKFVINCAGYTDVVGAEDNQDLADDVNYRAVARLAHVCRTIDAILIHISTDYIFDGKKGDDYIEEDTPNPLNAYGVSKLKGEQAIAPIIEKLYIIRTSWVYSHYEGNFVHSILNKMKKDKKVKVVGDQYGSPTSATDLAKLLLMICKNYRNIPYGTYNFSSDAKITWFEFAEMVRRLAIYHEDIKSKVLPLKYKKLKSTVKRPYYSVLNCDKIKEYNFILKLEYNWVKSLSESMELRYGTWYKSDLEIVELITSINHNYNTKDIRKVFAKLYRKIENLERRIDKD